MFKFQAFLQDAYFWCLLAADTLLVVSMLFAALYALGMLAVSLPPLKGRLMPSAWGLPLLFFLSVAFFFTPAGGLAIWTLSHGMETVYGIFGEAAPLFFFVPWVCGFLAGLGALALRCRAAGRAVAALKDSAADPAFEEARLRLPVKNVALKELASPLSPFSWGLGRGVVAIGPDFREKFDHNERYAVYLHELTHLKNHDSLKYILAGFVKALFWFNPVVRLALARYRNHLEIACDRSLIEKHMLNPTAYSRLMASALGGGPAFAPGFSASYNDLARRFGYIFGDAAIIPVLKDRLSAAACLALAALALAFLNPDFSVPENAPPPEANREMTAPDGQKGRIETRFQWQGALGGYAIGEFVKDSDGVD